MRTPILAALFAAVLAGAAAPAAFAMKMAVGGDQAVLEGPVEAGDPAQLRQIIEANKGTLTTIILRNSPGGDAAAGYAIGEMIRAAGLRTAVSGFCRSSCSRMFLGGTARQLTDEQDANHTHVAYHGNYNANGLMSPERIERLRAWIAKYSDRKADPELVARWTALPQRSGFMYFFDPTRLKRPDGVSMFLCQGNEPGNMRYEYCEKFPGRNGIEMGIFTSAELVKVNPAIGWRR